MPRDVSQESRDDHGRWNSRDVSGVEPHALLQTSRIFDIPEEKVTPHFLADLAGAPHGTKVTTDSQQGIVHVHINGGDPDIRSTRTFYSRPRPHIFNDEFKVKDEARQGSGIGATMLVTQVKTALSVGVQALYCDAAGQGDGTMAKKKTAGYYAWARMGYDGPVPDRARDRLPDPYAEAEKVSEIMAMDGGAEAWYRWGCDFPAKFDLTPGSQSLEVFRDYLAEKGKRATFGTYASPSQGVNFGSENSPTDGYREPWLDDILTPLDEEALDACWKARAHFHGEEGGDDRWRGGPRGLERTMPAPHVANPSPEVRAVARRIFSRHTSAPDLARLSGVQDSEPAKLAADGDALLIHACHHTTRVSRKGDQIHVEGQWPRPYPPGHNAVSRQVITRVKAAQKLGVHRVTLSGEDAYNMARFGFEGDLTEPVKGHTSVLDLLHQEGGHDTWEEAASLGRVGFKGDKGSLDVHPPGRGLHALHDYYMDRKRAGFADDPGGHDFRLDWEEDEALRRVWARRARGKAQFADPPDDDGPPRLDPSGEFRPHKKRLKEWNDHPDRTDASADVAEQARALASRGLEDHHVDTLRDSVSALSDPEAKHAFRSLVKGGHDPDNAHDAGAKLAQSIKNSRYYVPPPPGYEGDSLSTRATRDSTSDKHRKGVLLFQQEQAPRRKGAADCHDAARKALDEVLARYAPLGAPAPTERGADWLQSQSMRVFQEQTLLAQGHTRAVEEINARVRKYLAVALHTSSSLPIEISPPEKQVDPSALRYLTDAANWIGQMLARRPGEDGKIPVVPIAGHHLWVDGNVVSLTPWVDTISCVHLMGHVLENALPGVKPLCRQYLALRSGRNPPRDLGDYNPALKGVVARSCKFDPAYAGDKTRAMYAGRVYDSGATEILACGLELLYRDPLLFASTDPEWFNLILMLLRRALP